MRNPFALCFCFCTSLTALAATGPTVGQVRISTAGSELRLLAATDGHLYHLHYGRKQIGTADPLSGPARNEECYPCFGNGYLLEPALQVVHADGNLSTDLVVDAVTQQEERPDVVLTRIALKDRAYPFFVTLCFRAYQAEDVIEQWTEIRHDESTPVTLVSYDSASPLFRASNYWVTQFQGDVLREAEMSEERLSPGTKVLDSRLTVRADVHRNPSFILSLDGPAQEEAGEAIGGTLAWSGNFHFAFDLDWDNNLRVLCGANPAGAAYRLSPGMAFTTPAMLWSWSGKGKGQVSRNFHHWARQFGIRDGAKPRAVLLNNWESTFFDFDEKKLLSLMDGGKSLGTDLFLLDDGWFSDKQPSNPERVGLGDYAVNRKILPHGLAFLVSEAKRRGLEFGIWMEPEGVHESSELYRAHPEWTLRQPKRDPLGDHHQVLLDLSRPATRDYVWGAIRRVLDSAPGIGYFKWDSNRYGLQPGSDYLSAADQQNLPMDYTLGLYEVMRRLATEYPHVEAMLCAGGGGRVDYGALRYFDSFWPSDSTDALQRIYIQWGYSHVFPLWAMSAHITDMGHRPTKFTVDVALTGALGVDRDIAAMTPAEIATLRAGIRLYKEEVRSLVSAGDLYRLESPYAGKRAALLYALPDRSKAILFVYQLGETAVEPLKLRGLDPQQRYRVREVNLPAGVVSKLALNDRVVTGESLMNEGIVSPLKRALESAVVELVAVP